jgi:hypothetical protein
MSTDDFDFGDFAEVPLPGSGRSEGKLEAALPAPLQSEAKAFVAWCKARMEAGSASSYGTYIRTAFLAALKVQARHEELSFGQALVEAYPTLTRNVRAGVRKYQEYRASLG